MAVMCVATRIAESCVIFADFFDDRGCSDRSRLLAQIFGNLVISGRPRQPQHRTTHVTSCQTDAGPDSNFDNMLTSHIL